MSYITFLENLPIIPLDEILRAMSIDELFAVARASPGLKKYIPLLKMASGECYVYFGSRDSRIVLSGHDKYYSTYFMDPETALEYVDDQMNTLMSILKGDVEYMNVCPSVLWRDFSGSTNVLAVGLWEQEYSKWEREHMEDVSEEDINYLLDNIDFKKGLALNGPKELKTEHKKVFNIDWLRLSHTKWVTPEILRKLRNKIIYLGNVWLSPKDINEYIMDLVAGNGNSNLQVITFQQRYDENEKSEIMEGLDLVRNDQPQFYKFSEEDSKMHMQEFLAVGSSKGIEISDSLDFLREDGVRCSLVFDYESVTVYVWNQERNGKKQRCEEVEGPSVKRFRN